MRQEREALNQFLSSVEQRAYRMVLAATRCPDDALDIVQDAMIKLASKYATKDQQEWTPLFYRILQNQLRDWQRKKTGQSKWLVWWQQLTHPSSAGQSQNDAEAVIDFTDTSKQYRPYEAWRSQKSMEQLCDALEQLPPRQQQTFMLRCWEGLSTQQTADIMGCSSGSIKTHYSRALHRLREELEGSYEQAE